MAAVATTTAATTTTIGSNAGRRAVAIRDVAAAIESRLSRKINLMPKPGTVSSPGARPRARQKATSTSRPKTQSKPANQPADDTQLGALMSKSLDLAEASLTLGLNFVQRLDRQSV